MEMNLLLGVLLVIGVLSVLKMVVGSKVISIINRGLTGGLMIVVLNCLLPQYIVAVNLFTIGFVTLFGLPGIMTLYMFQFIF